MGIEFLGDQLLHPSTTSYVFTGNPLLLAWDDIRLFFAEFWSLPGTILPWFGEYRDDELTFNFANNYCIIVHGILVVLQLLFILSVLLAFVPPFCFGLPLGGFVVYFLGFCIGNYYICNWLLNGSAPWIESTADTRRFYNHKHDKERWIFLNGVSVGSHWLKSNINRLAKTFGRPVLGVHNPTTGIVFDVIECLIQRCFGYATMDIRNAYLQVKDALEDQQYNKVVFIVHSQGAIEGSMIVDWLLDEVPRDLLYKLEVYTFGNASNHMNNPHKSPAWLNNIKKQQPSRTSNGRNGRGPRIDTQAATNGVAARSDSPSCPEKAIGHIEHYAHTGDFVARWGVLHFTKPPAPTPANAGNPADPYINRFMGRIFIQKASGHMLNQHYLQSMFTLDPKTRMGCAPTNEFMEQVVSTTESANGPAQRRVTVIDSLVNVLEDGEKVESGVDMRNVGSPEDVDFPPTPGGKDRTVFKVKDLSRLWMYRNGMSPPS